ncbi:MAG: phosphoribosylformylglycinamidine synthase subunit PurS, partial [Planctomycetota bacterium]|nr:phosphoribosylformylglycinamidine synthase subunit PurS [Planctomycetota bacterium]
MSETSAPSATSGARTAYRIEVTAREAAYDALGAAVCAELRAAGVDEITQVRFVQVYALAGDFSLREAEWLAREFLVDEVVEMFSVNAPVLPANRQLDTIIEIVRRPGVMEPAEAAIRKGISLLGKRLHWLRTSRKFIARGGRAEQLETAARRILANEIIEHVVVGRDARLAPPTSQVYELVRREVPLRAGRDEELLAISQQNMLSLNLVEMKAIQAYFQRLGREPTDVELETIAQTWSEHCVHKTFRGRIRYREEGKPEEIIDNLLKSTIMRVTRELQRDWCWSVFSDNAGVIAFDEEWGAVFKVETHNHPSALEPYGGAGTGVGGVIRDTLGTGLGAKPILNTDVFCFGPPDLPAAEVPKGALHPLRVLRGVVAGVRDYGNRLGIPTANGAIYFDRRYTGNPLVFCGNVGIIPRRYATKRRPTPGQLALLVGGRTGRDGIHGATFSSAVLSDSSESLSSGAVQIGNPIEEKKVLDFLLRCRDAELYTCITDCGAGGLSSALGEMASECGVEAWLEKVPLKYAGLSYTEIWISEAQERMVLAADESKLPEIMRLAQEEEVEVTVVGRFTGDGRLRLLYQGVEVGCLEMDFLHRGLPQAEREARWQPTAHPEPALPPQDDYGADLRAILSAWNVCSKEWVIRQYDHEVQG